MEPTHSKLDQPAALPSLRPGPSAYVILALLAALLWLGVGWLVVISIPRSERLFAEFKMAVPLFTQMVIRFGPWAVPVLAVVSFLVSLKVRKSWAWLWFLIVLPAFIICAVFLSLYIPTMRLLEGLGGNAGWWEFF